MRNESGESRKPAKRVSKSINLIYVNMLNNKKNLLQRVRIAMLAIVTIMSIGGAFAMKAPSNLANKTYGYVSTTATNNHYVVTQTAAQPGYTCDTSPTICTIISPNAPALRNGLWEVAKNTSSVGQNGVFNP